MSLLARILPMLSRISWLALALCASAPGAVYHLAPDGDDSRSAAQVADPATPWKSLVKIAPLKLQPGDSVLLRRDGTWRGILTVLGKGEEGRPLVVAPYGPGTRKPRLEGTVTLSGSRQGGFWVAKAPGLAKAAFHGDVPLSMFRQPDTGWLRAGLENDSILVVPAASGVDWRNASALMITRAWALECRLVVASSGGRLALDRRTHLHVDSVSLFLANHAGAVSGREGWYQDLDDSLVRWTGSDSTLDVAVRDFGVELAGSSQVRVEGIHIFGTARQGVHSTGAAVEIRGCRLDFPGEVGVYGSGRGDRVVDNEVVGAFSSSIMLYAAQTVIQGNRIRRNAQLDWLGPNGMTLKAWGGKAIVLEGDSSLIRRNDLDSSGYDGIFFLGQRDTVDSNVVGHSCLVTSDGGNIYTWTGLYTRPGSQRSVIRHNIVHDSPNRWSHGIYLDDASHDIQVDSNISYRNVIGLFFHNNRDILVRGNLAFDNAYQVLFQHDTITRIDMVDLNLDGNTLVARPGQLLEKSDGYNGAAPPVYSWSGTVRCIDEGRAVRCFFDKERAWQLELPPPSPQILGAEILNNPGFDGKSVGWGTWPTASRATTDSGVACVSGRCARISFPSADLPRGALVVSNNFAVTAGTRWLLSVWARAARNGMEVTPYLRRGGGDYRIVAPLPILSLDTHWTRHDIPLTVTADEPNARLDFRCGLTDSLYWLDGISLRPLVGAFSDSLPPGRILWTDGTALGGDLPASLDPHWTWRAPGGDTVGEVSLRPFQPWMVLPGGVGETLSIQRLPEPSFRVWHRGAGIGLEGLRAPAEAFDVRGHHLGWIVPDAQGRGQWSPPPGATLVWIRSAGQVAALALTP